MSKLLQLTDELRDVHAEIARLESVISRYPESRALQIDFQSLSKKRRYLEAEFNSLADRQDLDVMRYRLMPQSGQSVPLRALAQVLGGFQSAISTIYDAVKSGPKQRAKLSADVYAESEFAFGYTFSGSLGIVLTVPNTRMLIDRSELDMAVAAFFEATESSSREEIVEFAKKYGVASVRRIYDWSAAHSDFDIAADINVVRGASTRSRLQVAPRTLRQLKQMIEETSDLADDPHEIVGRLAGLDVDKRTFHLVAPGGDDVEGRWSSDYVHNHKHLLDLSYAAKLTKRTKIHYALEKEETVWLLDALEPIHPGDN